MGTTKTPSRSLPARPSEEFLRKEAKRLARDQSLQLAGAQRKLAHEYGYQNWAELVTAVQNMSGAGVSGGGGGASTGPENPGRAGASTGRVYPLVPLRGLVTFPHVSYPIFVGRPKSINAVLHADENHLPLLLATQRDKQIAHVSGVNMYEVGTLGAIIQTIRLPNGTLKIVIEGRTRARVSRFMFEQEFSAAEATEIAEPPESDSRARELVSSVLTAFARTRVETVEQLDRAEALAVPATTTDDPSAVADRIASKLEMDLASKQVLLELIDPVERLEKLSAYIGVLQ